MSCNCPGTTPCTQPTTCTPVTCACPVLITSDCVNNVVEDLTCSNILKGQTLTEVLVQLDAYICTKFNSLTDFLTLINVGTGAKVYKGATLLGKKELRTLLGSNLITLTEGTNEITITVNETALNTFIEANQKTYSVSNAGLGVGIHKNNTVSGDNTQFNLKSLATSSVGAGESIIKDIDVTTDVDKIDLRFKSLSVSSMGGGIQIPFDIDTIADANKLNFRFKGLASSAVGTGTSIIKDIDTATDVNTINFRFKTLKSANSSVAITSTADEVDLSVDGSATKVTAGTNISVTGTGTTASPYVINNTSLTTVSGATTGGSSAFVNVLNTSNTMTKYSRVGNTVTARFSGSVTPTAVGAASFDFNLPINRTSAVIQMLGTGSVKSGTGGREVAAICTSTSISTVTFSFFADINTADLPFAAVIVYDITD